MAKGTGFGKTILIGDQFVLEEVPAIVSAISFETEAMVERITGEGWVLEDNRNEVPGYKEKKKEQQARSIDRILEVMNIDVKKIRSRSPMEARYWPVAVSVPVLPVAFRLPARSMRSSIWVVRSRRSIASPGRANSPTTGLRAEWIIPPRPTAVFFSSN